MANDEDLINSEVEYTTTDQCFAAYLATMFMFLEAIDTGERIGKGQYGNKKAFVFLVPVDEDMEQHRVDLQSGSDKTLVPFNVAFNKLRLMRQACRKPFNYKKVSA